MARRFLTLGVGGQVSFLPTDISGLVLWLKADDGPDDPVDGQPVSTWSDKSGQGNDVTQATAAKKPTYKANIVNGKPVVRFDGVDDSLQTAGNFGLSGNITLTTYVVFTDASGSASYRGIWGQGADTTARKVDIVSHTRRLALDFWNDRWRVDAGEELTLDTFYIITMTKAAGAISTTSTIYINASIAAASLENADSTPNVTNKKLVIGDLTDPDGANPPPFYPWKGDIAEVLIYTNVHTASERSSVWQYLNTKYTIY